jgi:hypothetical protein
MASCGLVQTAISVIGASVPFNATILAGVVTGIGFIGAGAIIRQGDFTTGHATAASIWTVPERRRGRNHQTPQPHLENRHHGRSGVDKIRPAPPAGWFSLNDAASPGVQARPRAHGHQQLLLPTRAAREHVERRQPC